MLIMSQDKTRLINFDQIIELIAEKEQLRVRVNGYSNYLFIGTFSSDDKAKKVLAMISREYKNSLRSFIQFDQSAVAEIPYTIQANVVFQVPEDSQLK